MTTKYIDVIDIAEIKDGRLLFKRPIHLNSDDILVLSEEVIQMMYSSFVDGYSIKLSED